MPDHQPLETLVRLRTQAGLSQEAAGKIIGVRRKAISSWETGTAIPEKRHRLLFLKYLLESLGLKDDVDTLKNLWEEIAIAMWDWDDLSVSEQWILELVQRPQQVAIEIPSLPPFLKIHPLVGRDLLISHLKQALLPGHNLALVGIPGVGKTAVAVTAAEDSEIRERFRDGILWASLSQHPDVLGSLGQWATAFGREISHLPTVGQRVQAVKNIIGKRRMLLIIDDAWDLAAARQLACGGPACCHLVITRIQSLAEAFATPAQVFRIAELDDGQGYELLSQLAPAAYAADQSSAQRLVHSVGGLPLALKVLGGYLAAPERRFFSSTTHSHLTALLDTHRRLQLAVQRLGTSADRAFTLQQVLELSLDTLPKAVVQTYFHLGAFAPKPAWFTRQAAETVSGGDTQQLSLLIDRNLLEIGTGEQLALHQVLADLARTRTPRVMVERHRTYYLRLVNENREDWRGIESLYPQLRWAWQRQFPLPADDESVFAFLDTIHLYQYRRGLWHEYLEWSEAALNLARSKNRLDIVATLLNLRGMVYDKLGDRVQALELYQESLELKLRLDDASGAAAAQQNIATIYHQIGQWDDALANYQQALRIMKQRQELAGQASILSNMGSLYSDLEQTEEALDCLHQVLSLRQQLRDGDGEATTLINIAAVYAGLLNHGYALEQLHQALTIAQQIGNRTIEAAVFHELSTLYSKLGQIETAIACGEKALTIRRQLHNRPDEARTLFSLGSYYRALGEQDKAREYDHKDKALDYYYNALTIHMEVLDRFAQLQALGFIGLLHEEVGNWSIALDYYEQGLQLATQLYNRLDEGALLQKIGDVLFKTGEFQQALEYYHRAIALAQQYGTLNQERGLRLNLVLMHKHHDQFELAQDHMRRVIEIDRLLNHPDLNTDLASLAELQNGASNQSR